MGVTRVYLTKTPAYFKGIIDMTTCFVIWQGAPHSTPQATGKVRDSRGKHYVSPEKCLASQKTPPAENSPQTPHKPLPTGANGCNYTRRHTWLAAVFAVMAVQLPAHSQPSNITTSLSSAAEPAGVSLDYQRRQERDFNWHLVAAWSMFAGGVLGGSGISVWCANVLNPNPMLLLPMSGCCACIVAGVAWWLLYRRDML
jgi:hypothetical protein